VKVAPHRAGASGFRFAPPKNRVREFPFSLSFNSTVSTPCALPMPERNAQCFFNPVSTLMPATLSETSLPFQPKTSGKTPQLELVPSSSSA